MMKSLYDLLEKILVLRQLELLSQENADIICRRGRLSRVERICIPIRFRKWVFPESGWNTVNSSFHSWICRNEKLTDRQQTFEGTLLVLESPLSDQCDLRRDG
ncbi:hypothetical protein C8R21_11218 [Nitrosospira multiformis]|uniref:Uncharacterized protein n=1 Tax=Nitrosospira multiformis TaxID=1231 RepID=A0A2T5IAZ3_9PROT|nr:hypothetical protein C8R21_11218 [Nitrosospira multiformis]